MCSKSLLNVATPLLVAIVWTSSCGSEPTTVVEPPVADTTSPSLTLSVYDTLTNETELVIEGTATDNSTVARVTTQRRPLPCCDGPVEDLSIVPGKTVTFSDTIALGNADYEINVVAYDTAGNSTVDTVRATSDQLPPSVFPIAPFYAVSSQEVISTYATDFRDNILDVYYSVNGSDGEYFGRVEGARANSPQETANRFAFVIEAPLRVGSNTVTITVADRAGNSSSKEVPIYRGVAVSKADGDRSHWCLLTEEREVLCWGYNEYGQLGNGTFEASPTPIAPSGGLEFKDVTTGWGHTCGLTVDGSTYCWGSFEWDHVPGLPPPDPAVRSTVPVLLGGGQHFVSIVGRYKHTCGLSAEGEAYCWGLNSSGELGDSTFITRDEPVRVVGGHRFDSLTAGSAYTCGLTAQHEAYCWGYNYEGELGTGWFEPWLNPTPLQVIGGHSFQSVQAGWLRTCGLTTDGSIYCWGNAFLGQPGGFTVHTPYRLDMAEVFRAVAVGDGHTCMLTDWAGAGCWGNKHRGLIGSIMTDPRVGYVWPPIRVVQGVTFSKLFAAPFGTCGISTSGAFYCWGAIDDVPTPILPSAFTGP